MRGLLDDVDRAAGLVERHDTVTLRIAHLIGEHGRTLGARHGGAQQHAEVVREDQVVAECERARAALEPVLGDQKGLCQAVRRGLLAVVEAAAEL